MDTPETSKAVVASLFRFGMAFLLFSTLSSLVAAVAGGALPGITILILAVSVVCARKKFYALRGAGPNESEKIALLFGSFLIALILASVIVVAIGIGHGYPKTGAVESVIQMFRAKPLDVLIVRYIIGALVYFLVVWLSYGPLLEGFAAPRKQYGSGGK